MFLTILAATFGIALATAFLADCIFKNPIRNILQRIIHDQINTAWVRYLRFALYIVGVSSGVRVWDLEKYITPMDKRPEPVVLTADRWILEIYRTVIGTLQGIAWLLLVFFIFALIAYVIVRLSGKKRGAR
jgi:hypothetical protein